MMHHVTIWFCDGSWLNMERWSEDRMRVSLFLMDTFCPSGSVRAINVTPKTD